MNKPGKITQPRGLHSVAAGHLPKEHAKKTVIVKSTTKETIKSKKSVPSIKNEQDYRHVMTEMEQLIKTGKGTIRNNDLTYYSNLAKAAQLYEQNTYSIAPPGTLEGLLEWKMYELKLKQNALAKKLHVSDAKLSLVMSGKQKPDASLLKSMHVELGIDGNVLLDVI